MRVRTVAAVSLFSAIWGYNWVVMKRALAYADALDFAAMRTGLGAVSLFVLMLALRRPLAPRALPGLALLGLLQTTGFLGLTFAALTRGGAGRTAVLVYTMPFWTLLLSRIFLGERIARAQWPPILLAFAGLLLVFDPFATATRVSAVSGGLAVAAGLSWAGSAVWAKHLRVRFRLDLISLTAWQMALGAVPLAAAALALPSRPIEWSPYFIGALVYNVVPGTALGWLLWLYVLSRMSAGTAGMATLAIPVIGVVSAAFELGERPGLVELSGMLLIVAGLALLSAANVRPR